MTATATRRAELEAASKQLAERFIAGESVVTLVHERATLVDSVLTSLWRQHAADCVDSAALVAVGGYGRGELHPFSDIDVMVLLPADFTDQQESQIGDFMTSLWDIGLEIGHSVRTVDQCLEEATAT